MDANKLLDDPYLKKYIKYKTKYLNLNEIKGGSSKKNNPPPLQDKIGKELAKIKKDERKGFMEVKLSEMKVKIDNILKKRIQFTVVGIMYNSINEMFQKKTKLIEELLESLSKIVDTICKEAQKIDLKDVDTQKYQELHDKLLNYEKICEKCFTCLYILNDLLTLLVDKNFENYAQNILFQQVNHILMLVGSDIEKIKDIVIRCGLFKRGISYILPFLNLCKIKNLIDDQSCV